MLYLALSSCSLCYVKLHVVHVLLFEQVKKEGNIMPSCMSKRPSAVYLLVFAAIVNVLL